MAQNIRAQPGIDGKKPTATTTLPGKSNDAAAGLPQHRGESDQRSPFIHAHERAKAQPPAQNLLLDSERMLRLAGAMEAAGLDKSQFVLLRAFLPEIHEILSQVKSDKPEVRMYNALLDHLDVPVGFARKLQETGRLSNLQGEAKEDLQSVLREILAAVPHLEARLLKITEKSRFGAIKYGQTAYEGEMRKAIVDHEEGKMDIVPRNTVIQTCALFANLRSLEPFFAKE